MNIPNDILLFSEASSSVVCRWSINQNIASYFFSSLPFPSLPSLLPSFLPSFLSSFPPSFSPSFLPFFHPSPFVCYCNNIYICQANCHNNCQEIVLGLTEHSRLYANDKEVSKHSYFTTLFCFLFHSSLYSSFSVLKKLVMGI